LHSGYCEKKDEEEKAPLDFLLWITPKHGCSISLNPEVSTLVIIRLIHAFTVDRSISSVVGFATPCFVSNPVSLLSVTLKLEGKVHLSL